VDKGLILIKKHDLKGVSERNMKSRVLNLSGCLFGIISLFSGCTTSDRLVNLTPELIPQNPSGIYSLSVRRDVAQGMVSEGDMRVVVGGKVYPMASTPGADGVYSFDYAMEGSANRALYYFEWVNASGKTIAATPVQEFRLSNRYVELETTRAQPGQAVAVLGRGFRDSDTVMFGGQTLATRYVSAHQLQFDVPAMDAGRSYPVEVKTGETVLPAGVFRIDYSQLRAVPQRIDLVAGESALVVFSVDYDAPDPGIPVVMQLTRPGLLEWDPATIEVGTRSVSVRVRAIMEGSGEIQVEARGHNRLAMPVMVRPRTLGEGL